MRKSLLLTAALTVLAPVMAQETLDVTKDLVHYSGNVMSNVDYHHGQLQPAIGVHNQQIMRANREMPQESDGYGWTYNHAPMMAYWHGKFYVEYLSDSVSEHIPPCQTLLMHSVDGQEWSKPEVIFPPYILPEGLQKTPDGPKADGKTSALMHQRVGFYVSKKYDKLLALAYYGIALFPKDDPNDGNGIGRVVREIKADGSYGPIYFLHYNHNFNAKNTSYPFYKKSRDRKFVAACDEILANPLYMMQMVEESDRDDALIPLKKQYKAFSYYHLDNGDVVGLWKHALTSISKDGGHTWYEPVQRAHGFVNSNAKIWGQRTSDGKFATVYNPSEYRWPLAVSTSVDGLDYTDLMLVHGELSPLRYGGQYKNRGPQYVRGIQEGNGQPADGKMWLTYSMNKEDIWVSSVPVPIVCKAATHQRDVFDKMPDGRELDYWNTYDLVWAPVKMGQDAQGVKCLTLSDKDPHDYAKAEKVFPASSKFKLAFEVQPQQNNYGQLQVEVQDAKGQPSIRISFNSDGKIYSKSGARYNNLGAYQAGQKYLIELDVDCEHRAYTVCVNGGRKVTRIFYAPAASLERVVFRTGDVRYFPTADTPADWYEDLPEASAMEAQEAVFRIYSLETQAENEAPQSQAQILKAEDYKHYVDYFNRMEDEPIAQAIPNAEAWDWMVENIPLFSCPQDNFEEMWYYRWWSLRKGLQLTPQGYVVNEFLVKRSYADKYNIIACAVGHHIDELRWVHNQSYLDDYLHIWLRGNEGKPMKKMMKYSSWIPYSLYGRYLVHQDKDYLLDLLPDLEAHYLAWEAQRWPEGLFWQGDVQDGMEESISGGRKIKNARPTINSYMYGNAVALAKMFRMAGQEDKAALFQAKADTLKQLVQTRLWNEEQGFFETRRIADGELAQVREAIGYIPWMFYLPDTNKDYEKAWLQVCDEQGFLAPYGLTTAERRHPQFRSHGTGQCEWDGAVWPFASSQTLTAMANVLNDYPQSYINDSVYFMHMNLYVESQYHRGRPYIGEYLDEVTGYWLKGDQLRSRYYNHSTFANLMVTGLMGLRPREDNVLEINPLIPQDQWDWFCMDAIPYHGKNVSILWDKDGSHFKKGQGFIIFVDGKQVARAAQLQKLEIVLD